MPTRARWMGEGGGNSHTQAPEGSGEASTPNEHRAEGAHRPNDQGLRSTDV